MNIAVILTCFNRKQQTHSCLKSLFVARDNFQPRIDMHIYLTDDGCTDGTADAVRESFPTENITILQGDGNLFWAGGMRFAWKEALKRHNEWEYYFLLNDDTVLCPNVFDEMQRTINFCISRYGREGIYSGACCSAIDNKKLTYGGHIFTNRFMGKYKHVWGDGIAPVLCDTANANVVLLHKTIVDEIGIFYEGYQHGYADYDYAIMARKHNIPVLVTADVCAICDNDHEAKRIAAKRIQAMTVKQRKDYFAFPTHSSADHLKFTLRSCPIRYPFTWVMRQMNIYLPFIYYKLHKCK